MLYWHCLLTVNSLAAGNSPALDFETLSNHSTSIIIGDKSQLIDFKTLDNYSTTSIIDNRPPSDCSTLNNHSTFSVVDNTDNSRIGFVDYWLLLEV